MNKIGAEYNKRVRGDDSELLVDRILHLNDETDRHYLIEKLKRTDMPLSCEELERTIAFLSDKLDKEWLTFYPWGHVFIKVGPKNSHGLDFFSEVVPLGLTLITLSDLKTFDRLTNKLNIQSYERLSAILEALSAARYKKKGYEVELEPTTGNGRSCDFRVRFEDEWIYFECKKENPRESKYYKRYEKYVNGVIARILTRVESKLPLTHRVDIILSKKADENMLNTLIDKILECLEAREFNQWKEVDGIKLAVNSRETQVKLPPLHVRLGRITVGTTPTKVSQESAHIQVIYNPFGSKELQKVRGIIREARDQLPQTSRGIIILETWHTERMVKIAEEKLKEPGYGQVIVILVIGNGAWSVPNALHQNFPLDFVKIAVLPNPN